MSGSVTFDAAWRTLNRRFRVLWLLLLGSLPGVFLLAYLLNDLLQQDASLAVIGLIWMTAIGWAGLQVASFACPRCGRAFFESWYFFKPLRLSCAHCDLRRDAKNIPPPKAGE